MPLLDQTVELYRLPISSIIAFGATVRWPLRKCTLTINMPYLELHLYTFEYNSVSQTTSSKTSFNCLSQLNIFFSGNVTGPTLLYFQHGPLSSVNQGLDLHLYFFPFTATPVFSARLSQSIHSQIFCSFPFPL